MNAAFVMGMVLLYSTFASPYLGKAVWEEYRGNYCWINNLEYCRGVLVYCCRHRSLERQRLKNFNSCVE
jgi:hypothetical protein